MSEIVMPRLSDSMEEGTILTWLRRDGEHVAVGDELLEVETDKAAMTVTAEVAGVLRIVVPEGTTVSVGTVIAQATEGAQAPAAPPPEPAAAPETAAGNGHATPLAAASGNGTAAVPATPLARRAAQQHGVALEGLTGSGPRGRITRADVLAAAGVETPAPPTPSPTPTPETARPAAPGGSSRELTRVQRLIARRMSESRTSIPEFEVQTEVQMDAALALRAQLRAQLGDHPVPSVNDLIVKAAALALRDHERLNASWVADGLRVHPEVNVGVAVATEEALVVATVRGADGLSLGALAAETRRLAGAVRASTIAPAELEGATFTVSNLGMFGMTAIRPIINAPQVAILGVGAAREVLALEGGEVVARQVMTLTLSCDHRVVYGADAARFLSAVRELLEAPLRLML